MNGDDMMEMGMEMSEMIISDNNAYLMAMGEGSRIEIHAADVEKESWTQLESTAEAGSNELVLQDNTGWEVGDKIAIAATGNDWEEAEEFIILSISDDGKTVTLDGDLSFTHRGITESYDNGQTGEDYREWDVEIRAEVALLSRNVTIQGDEDSVEDGYGGHTMVMAGAEQHIEGAEYYRMGQEDILGKYPIHWHMLGDAEGQYVEGVSIHESYQKGSTIHGTSNIRYEDNVVYDHVGHGVFFEDGSENGNQIIGNLVFSTQESETGEPIPTDGEHASSFWIENPNNVFIGNHAAGSESNGFWIFEGQLHGLSAETFVGEAGDLKDLIFIDNVGHTTCGDGGAGGTDKILGIDGTITDSLDFRQSTLTGEFGIIEGFTAYSGNVWALTHEMVFSDSSFTDVRFFTRHENVIEDSVFDDTQVIIYRDGGAQYNDVFATGNTNFIHLSTDHLNTANAFNNVILDTDADDVVLSADSANNQQVTVDIDGSVTGIPGAFLTPAGYTFAASPGATSHPDVTGLVSAYTIGATEITALGINGTVRILRSDGESVDNLPTSDDSRRAGDDPEDRSDANYEFHTTTGMPRDLAYLLDLPEMPDELTLNLTGVQDGQSVIYEIPGIVGNYRVTDDSVRVNSLDALIASEETAYYRGEESVFVRIVAVNNGVEEGRLTTDLLASFRASDSITMDITGFTGSSGEISQELLDAIARSEPDGTNPEPVIWEPEEEHTDTDFVLERYESTSDTTVVTDDMARWSDASTWGGAGVPGLDDIVVINAGQTVILNEDVFVKGIIVNGGELIIEDDANLEIGLSTDYLLVINGGLFQAGTEDDLLDTDFTLTLEGDDPDMDLHVTQILQSNVENTVFADVETQVVVVEPEPEPEPIDEPGPTPEPVDPDNLIVNGDFEDHDTLTRTNGSWDVFEVIPGWTSTSGQIELQDGVQLDAGNTVAELDVSENTTLEQVMTIEEAGTFHFTLDYAARSKATGGSSDFQVFINDEIYATIVNDNTSVETLEFDAELGAGDATIRIVGAGASDGRGALIDNVSLVQTAPADPVVDDTVLRVYLADTDTNETLVEITGGGSIALDDIMNRSVTIYAEAEDGAGVESIALFMDDTLTAVENVSPYALFGDNKGDFYNGANLEAGDYEFRLDAFSVDRGRGDLLESVELTLNVTADDGMANLMLVA